MTTHLASPLRLRSGVTLKNRFAKSAMSERLGLANGDPSDALPRLYRRLAEGGTGLLVTGNVMVSVEGAGEPENVFVLSGTRVEPFARWATAASSNGATSFMQINHAGRQAPRTLNPKPVAPSPVPLRLGLFAMPRALDDGEIERIVADFGRAAEVAKKAGFAGVQLHAAHGYLINQFLSPRTNLRTDRWGGSLENRMRFLMETFRRVRAVAGEGFAVSVKLNSADFLRGGFSNEDAVIVARTLDEEGIDLLEISGGTYERPEMAVSSRPKASTAAREAHFIDYARTIRAATSCPLMLTGGMRTPAFMESVVADGSIDVVGLARPLALEPDLPKQILAGRTEPSQCRPPSTRLRMLAAATDTAWHQRQLHRMSKGLEPDRDLGTLAALSMTIFGFLSARPPVPSTAAS